MSVAVALPGVRQRTPEWLEARRQRVGSSDAPVLAGERGSLYALWAEKRGLAEPEFDDETEAMMEIGAALEPALMALYKARQGRPIRARHVMLVRRDWPVAAASLDAESDDRIVELKWTHGADWYHALRADSPEPVPGVVMAQVQWQLYVTGRDVVDVAALVGREFRVITVGRDQRMIGDLEYMARDFWDHVESGEPPEPDGSEATTRTLRRLYPADDGTWLPADAEAMELVRSWGKAKAAAREATSAEETLENTLRAILGEHSGISGLVSNKLSAPSARVDWEAAASALADALGEAMGADPAVLLGNYQHAATTMKAGSRRLLLLKGGKNL